MNLKARFMLFALAFYYSGYGYAGLGKAEPFYCYGTDVYTAEEITKSSRFYRFTIEMTPPGQTIADCQDAMAYFFYAAQMRCQEAGLGPLASVDLGGVIGPYCDHRTLPGDTTPSIFGQVCFYCGRRPLPPPPLPPG